MFAYDYDAGDRLEFEYLDSDNNGTTDQTTAYDQTQQTEKAVTAGAVTVSKQIFGYNLQGRMASVTNDTFDGSGDLTARERTTYTYDSKSYRVQLVNESEGFDGNGDPTGVWTETSSTEFLADHHNHTGYTQTIRERTTNADGSTKTIDYTFGHDEIAQRVVERDSGGTITSDATHVFGHDGHGSVRVLYDLATAAANIAQAFTFSAYGQMIALHNSQAASSPLASRLSSLGYSGEHFDARAQQQYLRARFYNPANGRFNRLDPFAGNMQDPQSLHKYAYVHGDPIQQIDPTGWFSATGTVASISVGNSLSTVYNDAVVGAGQDIISGLLGQQVHLDPMGLALSALLQGLGQAVGFFGTLLRDALPIIEAGIFIESGFGSRGGTVSEETALNWVSSGINGPLEIEAGPAITAGSTASSASSMAFSVTGAAKTLFKGVSRAKYPVQLVAKSGKNKIYVAGHSMLGKFNKATGIGSSLFQRNHLSQDRAFRNLGPQGGIPYGQGLTVNMRGSIADGLQHFNFHNKLDDWWDSVRHSTPLPTVGQYNTALRKSLVHSGFTPQEARQMVKLAQNQQQAYGITSATRFKASDIPHRTT